MAGKIATFDDWMDLFHKWQKDIGFDATEIKDYKKENDWIITTHQAAR